MIFWALQGSHIVCRRKSPPVGGHFRRQIIYDRCTVPITPEMECCFAYNLIEIQKRWLEHSLRMVGSIALFDQLDHILKRGMRKTRKMSLFYDLRKFPLMSR